MRVPLGVVGIIYESRPERDRRCRGAVPQGRQRDDPARRLGGAAQQPRDRRLRARRPARRGPARSTPCRSSRRTDRAAVGHLIADEKHVDVDRAARRQGPDRAHRARGEGAGDQAPRRRVPRLHRRRRPTSTWRCASPTTRRRSATRRATRWRRCSCTPTSPRACCRRSAAIYASKGVELRGCERSRALVPAMKAGDRGRLVHRVPRADPRGARRRLARRGDRAHREVRLAAHRRDRHRGLRATRCASCARSIRAR